MIITLENTCAKLEINIFKQQCKSIITNKSNGDTESVDKISGGNYDFCRILNEVSSEFGLEFPYPEVARSITLIQQKL